MKELNENGFNKLGLLSQIMDDDGWKLKNQDFDTEVTTLTKNGVELSTKVLNVKGEDYLVQFSISGPKGNRDIKLLFTDSTNLNTVLKQLNIISSYFR